MDNVLEKFFVVEENETARMAGSGHLPVLSTPHMIAYMENTALNLLSKDLNDGETSVGIEIIAKHLNPTPVGREVTVKAQLIEQTKNMVTFEIEARSSDDIIGTASHTRAIVDEERFMKQLIE